MIYNKTIHDEAKTQLGLADSVSVDGNEFALIPQEPYSLLFWSLERIATPIFNNKGELISWRIADVETRNKFLHVVDKIARENGYKFAGLDVIFRDNECEAAKIMVIEIATHHQRSLDMPACN